MKPLLETSGEIKPTLGTSVEDVKPHSKRVGKIKPTLETSGEDVKLHSNRAENKVVGSDNLALCASFAKTTLETSVVLLFSLILCTLSY